MNDNQARVDIIVDGSQAVRGLGQIDKAADRTTGKLEKVGAAGNISGGGRMGATSAISGRMGSVAIPGLTTLVPQVQVATQVWSGFNPIVAQSSSQLALMNQRTFESSKAFQQLNSDLPVTRHAMRDAAFMFTAIGLGAGAAVIGVNKVGASFETAFTGVERTADLPVAALASLRNELVQLSTDIPATFAHLTDVATLGGQLGIAGDAIGDFTKEVTMFSATTDASLEKTGEGFGRLAQLTDMTQGQFANLSSSIYSVGVTTVATESSILSVSQEIATAADLAGFTTEQIVGLSGAFASLAIQPERARGNVLRIFGEIDKAISGGGEQLKTWADLAKMSADEFRQAWATNAGDTFQGVIKGMEDVINAGGNLREVLSSLGIKNVRDVQTVQQLANNYDLLAHSMNIAAEGWATGSATAEAYGKVSDNVEAKLQMLKNAIDGVMDTMSNNAPIATLLSGLINITNAIRDVMATGVGRWIGGFVTVVGSSVAVFALVRAGILMLQSGYLALITVVDKTSSANQRYNLTLSGMLKGLVALSKPGATAASVIRAQGVAADSAASSMGRMSAMARGAGAAVTGLVGGLARMVPYVAAFWALGQAASWLGQQFESTEKKMERLGFSTAGLSEALAADQKVTDSTARVYREITRETDEAIITTNEWSQVLADATGSQETLTPATDTATAAIENQTVKIGENARAWAANQIVNNPEALKIFEQYGPMLDQMGLKWDEFLNSIASGTGAEYMQPFIDKVAELDAATTDAMISWQKGEEGSAEAYRNATDAATEAYNAIGPLMEMAKLLGVEIEESANKTNYMNALMGEMGAVASDTEGDFESLDMQVNNLAKSLWGSLDSASAFESAMYNLGASLVDNGTAFDIYSEAGRNNIAAMSQVINSAVNASGGDMNALAQMLAQALAALGGTSSQMGQLFLQGVNNSMRAAGQDATALIAQVKNLAPTMKSASFEAGGLDRQMKNLGGGGRGSMPKAAKAAKSAAQEIRTLKDYISDLSGVMKRSFELRWSAQMSGDDVANQFYDMADGLEKAKEKVADLKQELRELQAEMGKMKSDEGTLTYQLGVAKDYGDDLRVKEIEAELTKLRADQAGKTADLAKKNKELGTAQQAVNRDLSGNTQASRDQRKEVLALVQSYQDQILALADSGRSQAEVAAETERLRQQFIAQMLQLGYNTTEAYRYAKSFDDMTIAINNVPKNLTMSVNMNPAITALNEFVAKAKKSGADAGSGYGSGFRGATGSMPSGFSSAGAGAMGDQAGRDFKHNFTKYLNNMVLYADGTGYLKNTGIGKNSVRFTVYAGGGFTGRGDKYEEAGIVHRGEYVIPKEGVNQATGIPYMLEPGTYTGSYAANARTNSSSTATVGIVELGPQSIRAIEKSGGAVIVLDGKVVAQSVNQQNVNSTNRGV